MTIESELRAFVLADGTVSGLIAGRFYPVIAPQGTAKPYATYQRISGPRLRNLDGPAGRAMPRIQIDAWAIDYAGAVALAGAIRSRIDGHNGLLTTIRATVQIENERDDYDEQANLHRVSQDYLINHTE